MRSQLRVCIDAREPFADGMSFGDVGPYERLTGWLRFAIDPEAPAYGHVVDLKHAPQNAAGLVEYATEFFLIKPIDLARGNGGLLYDVINRGNKRALQFLTTRHTAMPPCGPNTLAMAS